jgi:predicted amidohydrolase
MEVFETGLGKVGMFICYDLAFPEITRLYALRGARIAALTTAWPMKGDDHTDDYYGYTYDILSRSNALMNQMWMVCSNQVGRPDTPGTPNYYGHSRIIAPDGTIVTDIGYEEGLAVATVDLVQGIEDGRTVDFFGLNLLQDRRPTYYGDIAREKPYYPLSSDFNYGSETKKGVSANGSNGSEDHVYDAVDAATRG